MSSSTSGSISSHLDYDYDFVPPLDAPTFTPTMDEFKDFFAYYEKIRVIGEQYGICKIKPPDEWAPPFAVDVDKLKFTPRIQRLNELEAHTRIKLNYLDQVAKFWELQGSSLKIPIVDKRALDLYTLKKYVEKVGGLELVNEEKLWGRVASEMGYSPLSSAKIGAVLKSHYERIIYPLDVFEKEEKNKMGAAGGTVEDSPKKEDSPQGKGRYMGGQRSGTLKASPEDDSKAFSKELARLQFFGAGPKLPGMPDSKSMKDKTRGVKLNYEYDPLAKYMCQTCSKGDAEEQMLLCDGCDDSYHTFCLLPPLEDIPEGDWRCPKCVLAEVSKPMEAFGFEQAQKEYTLQSFGEMADNFKSDYFNMPVHLIPMSLVEREYWRILDNIDEDVMVEYGADLHTMDHGSGFPTTGSKHLNNLDLQYAEAEFNLNNLPVVANSILKHVHEDISGMKVPWLYVGMCFSTFCWHVEDHWTPSINFLHWGEPKTWYGISAKDAEKAEAVMRSSASELFQYQPDLLHHIVTTMNPNVLQAHGISVHRLDQYAGEFILTFPRSYHAGFNHGFNLAEAVNFAPPDWLPIGRKCVEHYSQMRRFNVFCHDELVCKMATYPETLTLQIAASCYKDMLTLVESERAQRKALLLGGVKEAEREAFELLPEEERQCAVCKTICFISALTIINGKEDQEVVCLRHFSRMQVDPASLILRYRYTLDELATLLQGLKTRAESYDTWTGRVRAALEAKGESRLEFHQLKAMYTEARDNKYPESDLLEALQLTVEEADKCQMVAQQLCASGEERVHKPRTRGSQADAKYRLTVEELQLFANQLETLPARVSGHMGVRQLLVSVASFREEAGGLLTRDTDLQLQEVEGLLEKGEALEIELLEVNQLRAVHSTLAWLLEVGQLVCEPKDVSAEAVRQLEIAGRALQPCPKVHGGLERLGKLTERLDAWEERAKSFLQPQGASKPGLLEVEHLVSEGEALSLQLTGLQPLRDSVRRAREWWARAEQLQKPENYPYLDTLEALVARGKPINIRLDPLNQLETEVTSARAWRERTARVFLKKNSHYNLLEVLSPRYEFDSCDKLEKKRKRKLLEEHPVRHPIFQGLSAAQLSDPREIVKAFKQAEQDELVGMRSLRSRNLESQGEEAGDPGAGEQGAKEGQCLLDCELCREQFQPGSAALVHTNFGNKGEDGGRPQSLRDIKFLCPSCLRSRRPRLETILSLLVSLQKLTVRLPEGEALQCLTERAMAWQDRAKTLLAKPIISSALEKLGKTKGKDGEEKEMDVGESGEPVVIDTLEDSTILALEDMMMEGDLLEVTLDEVKQLWQLLQATPARRAKQLPELDRLEAELVAAREERRKEKQKKRAEQGDTDRESERERKKLKKKRKEEARLAELQEANNHDDCSASNPKCKRPTGKQVHWVQCDKCELWYHLFCIGLKPNNIKEDEDFYCKNCTGEAKK